jgi:hypothetical protein
MEITGELFIDVPAFRRIAKVEFARAEAISTMAMFSIALSLYMLVSSSTALSTVTFLLGLVMIFVLPGGPVRRLTRRYRDAGPVVWHYRIDERGFQVTGRRTVSGTWARYTKVAETRDLWLVRPPFASHRLALPKAAFAEADRAAVGALIRGRRPATVPA